VIEAGQKGVVLLNKLDNGQYEVAPGPGAKVASAEPAHRARPGAEPGREGREEGARRGRGRRGRGGRDRSGRDAGARANGHGRPEAGYRPAHREERPEAGLTLARAFQLMSQALSEFRSPVGQEALRLRMVAMHGREDPLLDAGRFPRLLRQANDAEVADVRKVGDDDYEISAQRTGLQPSLPPASSVAEPASTTSAEPATTDAAAPAGVRENGQRLGLRFRRGSRAPLRPGDIPLIGVVQMEPPATATAETETVQPDENEQPARRPRPRRPRKRSAVDASASPAQEDSAQGSQVAETESAPAKRPRTRSRKKAE
jgi:ribonuclease E